MPESARLVDRGLLGQSAQFGDEAEFHLDQVTARGRRRVVVAHRPEVAFRLVEVAGAACAERETHDREDLAEEVALLGGRAAGPLVEQPGPVPVAGQEREAAQAGEAGGGFHGQPEFFREAQSDGVAGLGVGVIALDLGECGERRHGLQLPRRRRVR